MRIAVINLIKNNISGGYWNYIVHLMPRILSFSEITKVYFFIPHDCPVVEKLPDSIKLSVYHCNQYNVFSRNNNLQFREILNDFSPDILFFPIERNFSYKNIPIVTLVQNMEPFANNNRYNGLKIKSKLFLQRIIAKNAIKRSDRIIALSTYVKDYINHSLNIPNSKISIISHGVDYKSSASVGKPPPLNINWEEGFIFSAGSIRPARGIEDLIHAGHHLRGKNINVMIVIAGVVEREALCYFRHLNKLIIKYQLSKNIIFSGKLSKQEMEWCYRNSNMFIMTSRVESFGMIAAEAMANGCVCISTRSSCLPELFRTSALYYNSGDYQDLANNITKVLKFNEYEKCVYVQKAQRRARDFSWDICAERTKNTFLKLVDSKQSKYND